MAFGRRVAGDVTMSIDPNKPIDYRYLNMRTRKFCKDEHDLMEQIRGVAGAIVRAIPATGHEQVIIAAGVGFTEFEAILLSRKLTGGE